MKGRFGRGDTLVWKADDYSYGQWAEGELGDCQNVDFDRDAQFNLVYSGSGRGNRRYCPSLIEFLTRSEDSDFLDSWKKLNLNSDNGHWFSERENNLRFSAIPNSEAVDIPATCPAEGQGCPVNELIAFRKKPQKARQQCIFQCPKVKRVLNEDGQMVNIGEICHEVTYQVDQYEYCCQSSGSGFDVCPNRRSRARGQNENHQDNFDWQEFQHDQRQNEYDDYN